MNIVNNLARKMASYFSDKNSLDNFKELMCRIDVNIDVSELTKDDQIDVYEYNIKALIIPISKIIFILIIALMTKTFIYVIIILIPYLFLRKHVEGYHYSTYMKCLICSVILINGFGIIVANSCFNMISTVIINSFVIFFSIKKVYENQKAINLLFIYFMIQIIFFSFSLYEFLICISYSIFIVVFSSTTIGEKILGLFEKN